MVKVIPFDAPAEGEAQRIGFMDGLIEVPDDFDQLGTEEIEALFSGQG